MDPDVLKPLSVTVLVVIGAGVGIAIVSALLRRIQEHARVRKDGFRIWAFWEWFR